MVEPLVPLIRLDDVESLERELGTRRVVLLSASVPSRSGDGGLLDLELSDGNFSDEEPRSTIVHAARIRDCASALARAALMHGYRLVCRAHPSVTPMLLQAASDLGARKRSVVVFVTADDWVHGDVVLPHCNWSAGVLVVVRSPYGASAHWQAGDVRKLMVRLPGIEGAVFIGGLQDVLLDADEFRAAYPNGKSYAVESTGAAAEALARSATGNFHGGLDASLLRDSRSYSLVAHRIMMDLPGTSQDGAARVALDQYL